MGVRERDEAGRDGAKTGRARERTTATLGKRKGEKVCVCVC